MASRGRGPIVCPECREVKPDHALGCAFGNALREGRAQDRRRNLSPEVRALRSVVAGQVYQPFIPGPESFADLVDRITDAVSAHLAGEDQPKQAPTGAFGCAGCGAPVHRTEWGLSILHAADCPIKPIGTMPCGVRRSHNDHEWGASSSRLSCPGVSDAPVTDWKDAPAGTPCPGCGALRSGERSGLFTLHHVDCPGPNVPAQPSDPVPVITDPLSQDTVPIRYCGPSDPRPCPYTRAQHDTHEWTEGSTTYRCPGVDV